MKCTRKRYDPKKPLWKNKKYKTEFQAGYEFEANNRQVVFTSTKGMLRQLTYDTFHEAKKAGWHKA
jgi:hypothetical protein